MVECVVLYRNPRGQVKSLHRDSFELVVFKNKDKAVEVANKHPLFMDDDGWPYQIVELEEL